MYQTTTLEVSPRGIATIILNRPAKGNAFNQIMLNELGGLLSELADNARVRVVVLRGNGKHFCAGADVSRSSTDGDEPASRQYSLHEILTAIDSHPKPTVAIVHGAAVGGGAAFVACCDVAVASEAAFLSIPEVRIGMAPVRLAPLFIRAMGYRSFRRYGLSGERIGAAEALRIGLVHEVCPADELEAKAADIIDALLHGAPGALGELKRAAAAMASPPLQDASAGEPGKHEFGRSPEAMEGLASFREKRKPNWYPAP